MPATIEEALIEHFRAARTPGIVSAYLFGSEAEDRSHRESDVDVAVLLDRDMFRTDRARFDERVRLATTLGSCCAGRTADIVVLNEAPPQFARRIVTEGRRLYCADERADREFAVVAQLRAADIEPFLQRMRRIKLDSLGYS